MGATRHHFLAKISLKPTPALGLLNYSELGWATLTTWCPLSWGLNQPSKIVMNFGLHGIKFMASGLGCLRRQSDLDFLDAHLSRFRGCSFMLALRETLSTYWIQSMSSRLQPRRRTWACRLDLSTILCHTALWGLFCEMWNDTCASRYYRQCFNLLLLFLENNNNSLKRRYEWC